MIWVVSELMKSELEAGLNTKRLTGSRTRGSPPAYEAACIICTIDVFVSRPAVTGHRRRLTIAPLLGRLFGQAQRLQLRHSFANHFAAGLIFRHGLGAFLGALFLLETRLGAGAGLAGPGIAGFGGQYPLLGCEWAPQLSLSAANQCKLNRHIYRHCSWKNKSIGLTSPPPSKTDRHDSS